MYKGSLVINKELVVFFMGNGLFFVKIWEL